MIIAVYTDRYNSEYIQIGNTIEEVMENLEWADESELDMNRLKVFTGVEVKVTKNVSYTVETV